MKRALPIIFMLTAISFLIVDGRIIKPQLNAKYELQQRILSGTEESHEQYSILSPAVTFALQKMISTVVTNNQKIRTWSFRIFGVILFGVFFFSLYQMLRISFDEVQTYIGLALAQVLLAYILQDHYTEPAMLNLIFFVMSMLIILLKKDLLLPFILLLGAINEPQIIAVVAFYILYQFGEKKLFKIKSVAVVLSSIVIWIFVNSFLQSYYGLRVSSASLFSIPANMPMLLAVIVILIILALKPIAKSDYIFRMSLMFIPLYILITMMLMPEASYLDFAPAIILLIPSVLYNFESVRAIS